MSQSNLLTRIIAWAQLTVFVSPMLPTTQALADDLAPGNTPTRRDKLEQLKKEGARDEDILFQFNGSGVWIKPEAKQAIRDTYARITRKVSSSGGNAGDQYALYQAPFKVGANDLAKGLRAGFAYIPDNTRARINESCSRYAPRKGGARSAKIPFQVRDPLGAKSQADQYKAALANLSKTFDMAIKYNKPLDGLPNPAYVRNRCENLSPECAAPDLKGSAECAGDQTVACFEDAVVSFTADHIDITDYVQCALAEVEKDLNFASSVVLEQRRAQPKTYEEAFNLLKESQPARRAIDFLDGLAKQNEGMDDVAAYTNTLQKLGEAKAGALRSQIETKCRGTKTVSCVNELIEETVRVENVKGNVVGGLVHRKKLMDAELKGLQEFVSLRCNSDGFPAGYRDKGIEPKSAACVEQALLDQVGTLRQSIGTRSPNGTLIEPGLGEAVSIISYMDEMIRVCQADTQTQIVWTGSANKSTVTSKLKGKWVAGSAPRSKDLQSKIDMLSNLQKERELMTKGKQAFDMKRSQELARDIPRLVTELYGDEKMGKKYVERAAKRFQLEDAKGDTTKAGKLKAGKLQAEIAKLDQAIDESKIGPEPKYQVEALLKEREFRAKHAATREKNREQAALCEKPAKDHLAKAVTDDFSEILTVKRNGKEVQYAKASVANGVSGVPFGGYLVGTKIAVSAQDSVSSKDGTGQMIAALSTAKPIPGGNGTGSGGGKKPAEKKGKGAPGGVEGGVEGGKAGGTVGSTNMDGEVLEKPVSMKLSEEKKPEPPKAAPKGKPGKPITAEEVIAALEGDKEIKKSLEQLVQAVENGKPMAPDQFKAIMDKIHDNRFASSQGDGTDDFHLYSKAGSWGKSDIGGTKLEKCAPHLRMYCNGGSEYDIKKYKHTATKVDTSGITPKSTPEIAENTDPNAPLDPNSILPITQALTVGRQPEIEKDLKQFIANMWIDKYIDFANIYNPGYADLSKLKAKVASLSCMGNNSKDGFDYDAKKQLEERIVKSEAAAQALVKELNGDAKAALDEEATAKKGRNQYRCSSGLVVEALEDCATVNTFDKTDRYRSNMANAAQCLGTLVGDMRQLRDDLGLDIKYFTTLEEEEAKAMAGVSKAAGGGTKGAIASTAVGTMKSVALQMVGGPIGTLFYAWMKKMPLIQDMGDKKPCSMVSVGADLPLYQVGNQVYDPQMGPVPDDIVAAAEGWKVSCKTVGGKEVCTRDENGREVRRKDGATVVKLSRAMVCTGRMREMQRVTEEVGTLLAAYPALGMDPSIEEIEDGKDMFDFMGYKDVVDPKQKNERLERWKKAGKHGPCMSAFRKDPNDPASEPLKTDDESYKKSVKLVKDRSEGMLNNFLKELGKVCDDSDAVVSQVMNDADLMERFYSCEDTRFANLLTYHDAGAMKEIDRSKMSEERFRAQMKVEIEQWVARQDRIAKYTDSQVPTAECRKRQDLGPLLCTMSAWEQYDKNSKKIKEGAMELAFLALEGAGARGVQRAFIQGIAKAGVKEFGKNLTKQQFRQRALAIAKSYAFEATVGAGFGIGGHYLMDDSAKRKADAEFKIAKANAGLHVSLREVQEAAAELDKLAHEGGAMKIIVDGAVGGILFKMAMGQHVQAKKGAADIEAMKLADDMRAFGESQHGGKSGFDPATQSLAEARAIAKAELAKAKAAGDKTAIAEAQGLDRALSDFDRRLDDLLSQAPDDSRNYIKSRPINDAANKMKVLGKTAMKTDKPLIETINNARKLKDSAARMAAFRKAIASVYGDDVAKNLTNEQLARMMEDTPVGFNLGKIAFEMKDKVDREVAAAKSGGKNTRDMANVTPDEVHDALSYYPGGNPFPKNGPVIASYEANIVKNGLGKRFSEYFKTKYAKFLAGLKAARAKLQPGREALRLAAEDMDMIAQYEVLKGTSHFTDAVKAKYHTYFRKRALDIIKKSKLGVADEAALAKALEGMDPTQIMTFLENSAVTERMAKVIAQGLKELDDLPEVNGPLAEAMRFVASKEGKQARDVAQFFDEGLYGKGKSRGTDFGPNYSKEAHDMIKEYDAKAGTKHAESFRKAADAHITKAYSKTKKGEKLMAALSEDDRVALAAFERKVMERHMADPRFDLAQVRLIRRKAEEAVDACYP